MKWQLRILILCVIPFAANVQGATLDEPVALPVFGFHDEHCKAYASAALREQWTPVNSGLLTCQKVYSLKLSNFEAAIASTVIRVCPERVTKVWFQSVDLDNDGPLISKCEVYVHPDFPLMTDACDQVGAFLEAKDGFCRRMAPDHIGHCKVQHSSPVSVVATDGTLRTKLQPPLIQA